jgi:hypothetical protein
MWPFDAKLDRHIKLVDGAAAAVRDVPSPAEIKGVPRFDWIGGQQVANRKTIFCTLLAAE